MLTGPKNINIKRSFYLFIFLFLQKQAKNTWVGGTKHALMMV